MILLDTHIWFYYINDGVESLTPEVRQAIHENDTLGVSVISCWEIAMLVRSGRLALAVPTAEWHRGTLELGILEAPVSGQIGILAGELAGLPGDPADRIITATAMVRNATLLTADRRILDWSGNVLRHDARE